MATLNRIMLMGRLTDDPEPTRTIGNGTTVIRFRFAVGRSRKNHDTGAWENDPNPLYIDCEAFHRADSKRNLPELIAKFCEKGTPLYIDGRLVLDTWDDKNGGGKRSKHKVVVENVEFLGGKAQGDPGGRETVGAGRTASLPMAGDDDGNIPF